VSSNIVTDKVCAFNVEEYQLTVVRGDGDLGEFTTMLRPVEELNARHRCPVVKDDKN
jgi:hypothetical protein